MRVPDKSSIIRFLLWAAVLLWMALIFSLSAQQAAQSSSLSGSTIKTVVSVTHPDFKEWPMEKQNSLIDNYQHAVRKSAHAMAYLVLGALCMTALYQYLIKGGWRFAAALAICAGYAVTDELHQLFVAGRSGQITDVCIDTGGALLGILIVWLAHWAVKRKAAKDASIRYLKELNITK